MRSPLPVEVWGRGSVIRQVTLAMLSEGKVKILPARPGAYLMKDEAGKVLYVGKAKNLLHRVRSYLGAAGDSRFLVRFFISKVEDVECLVTDTEKEALILENHLIKKHKPRYNINLKDDKTYLNLRLDVQNPFSKLTLVRRVRMDGARYFGPFSSSRAVKETINFIQRTFQLRRCSNSSFRNRSRPCLYYQMHQCQGGCVGLVDEQAYRERVNEVVLFLEGKNRQLIQILRRRMEETSRKLLFEEAACLRDQIQSIEKTIERQKIVSFQPIDRDVIAYYREGALVEIHVMSVRQGKVVDGQSLSLSSQELSDAEIVSSFVKQFYTGGRLIPQEILLPLEIEDREAIAEWFSEQRGGAVRVKVPRRGPRLQLLHMAGNNAEVSFAGKQRQEKNLEATLEELKHRLRLIRLPRRVECFDISNILGTSATGSMVVFQDGMPEKSGYRHFKIRTLAQPDDYGMMYEVLMRRYAKVDRREDLPDLTMVDGGRGHLQVVLEAFKDLKLNGADAIALAKSRHREGLLQSRDKTPERVYVPRAKEPIHMPKHSAATFLLQRIRDESHRFAITYHKKLRKKRDLSSLLDDIPGIGKARRQKLLTHFKTLTRLRAASIGDLQAVLGSQRKTAEGVYQALHPPVDRLMDERETADLRMPKEGDSDRAPSPSVP